LLPDARQKGIFAVRFSAAHGKDLIFAVRFAPRRTAKGVTRRLIPVPSVAFFCRAS
jgi:hypothetical protein